VVLKSIHKEILNVRDIHCVFFGSLILFSRERDYTMGAAIYDIMKNFAKKYILFYIE